MKKLFYLLFGTLVFTSCIDDVNPSNNVEFIQAQYANAFTNTFGEVASNQTWGFSSSSMRGANSTFTKWQSDRNWENMPNDPITQDEINFVLNYIAEHPDEGGTECDLTDYYMQNVGSSKDSYHVNFIDGNGNVHHSTDIVGGNQMDYLVIDGLHINDYNATIGSFGFAENLPLQDITYHDSYANLTIENAYKFYYIEYNGKVNLYLCFDYRTSKEDNGQLIFDGDGVYNDWVVKLSPADGRVLTKPGEFKFLCRVFAEDLSATNSTDFDFNDVVFDVYTDGTDAKVQLLAAGGTLELTVAGHEVHKAFGVSTTTMVNTGEKANVNGLEAEPFIVEGVSTPEQVRDNIHIVVTKLGTLCELHANQGEPAAKFAIPAQVAWADERQDIRSKYSNFGEWINNPSVKWWE